MSASDQVLRQESSAACDGSAAPFLKWVGGKGRLCPALSRLLPGDVERRRHVEPFLGGGALFFARSPQRARLSDINKDLIATYCAVRDDVDGVLVALRELARTHSPEAYYARRDLFNRTDGSAASRAALFVYLNRTCFNGLYRVNRLGRFNVPMGRYAAPSICDEARLRDASAALQGVELQPVDFREALASVSFGDFVYLDPPYVPTSRTANFAAYSREGFTQTDQLQLRDVFGELDRRGARLMLSNSDAPFVRALYAGFPQQHIYARRSINSDVRARGPVRELVITNYSVREASPLTERRHVFGSRKGEFSWTV